MQNMFTKDTCIYSNVRLTHWNSTQVRNGDLLLVIYGMREAYPLCLQPQSRAVFGRYPN